MSQIDNPRRLQVDEISDDNRDDFRLMSELYNYFVEQVTNTINGQIGIDNLTRELVTVEVTVDSNGNPILGGTFSASTGMIGHNVIRAENLTSSTVYPTSTPFLTYTATNTVQNLYKIQNVTGLPANNKFKLYIELIPNF